MAPNASLVVLVALLAVRYCAPSPVFQSLRLSPLGGGSTLDSHLSAYDAEQNDTDEYSNFELRVRRAHILKYVLNCTVRSIILLYSTLRLSKAVFYRLSVLNRSVALLRTALPASSATSTTACAICVGRCSTRAAPTRTAVRVSSAAPAAASRSSRCAHAVWASKHSTSHPQTKYSTVNAHTP